MSAIIFRTRGTRHFWAVDAATGEAIGEPHVDVCDMYRIAMRLSPPVVRA